MDFDFFEKFNTCKSIFVTNFFFHFKFFLCKVRERESCFEKYLQLKCSHILLLTLSLASDSGSFSVFKLFLADTCAVTIFWFCVTFVSLKTQFSTFAVFLSFQLHSFFIHREGEKVLTIDHTDYRPLDFRSLFFVILLFIDCSSVTITILEACKERTF